MRPVAIGSCPSGPDGAPRRYAHYRDARDDLINRMGQYCAYCESRMTDGIDVEHVLPKDLAPHLERSWDNFVLSCGSCNTFKSVRPDPPVLDGHVWPHLDNTFRAFDYLDDGTVTPLHFADAHLAARVHATYRMVQIERRPHHRLTKGDFRHKNRLTAIAYAREAVSGLAVNNSEQMRGVSTNLALATGFFSVWMRFFVHDADMRQRFINAFPGTAAACFDADTTPLTRPGRLL